MKYKKEILLILIAIVVLAVALIISLLAYFIKDGENHGNNVNHDIKIEEDNNSDNIFDKKYQEPQKITKEEYDKMTPGEQAILPDSFESMEDYKAWYEAVIVEQEKEEQNFDIDINVSEAEEYTFEDYDKLTPEEKAVFPDCFESMEAYNKWYERVVEGTENQIEEKIDFAGKDATDMTLEEYNALTIDEKAILPDYFDSMEQYKEWYNRVVKETMDD